MLKRRGARTDPCGTPFLRRRNRLVSPFPVVKVKLRLPTVDRSLEDFKEDTQQRYRTVALWVPQ